MAPRATAAPKKGGISREGTLAARKACKGWLRPLTRDALRLGQGNDTTRHDAASHMHVAS